MPIFNGFLEPKKSAIKDGAIPLAIALEAPNKKVAESIIVGKLWEFYPANGDNYFKPKVWEDAPGQDRPELGRFDEVFAKEHTFDGEKWIANKPETEGFPAPDEEVDLLKVSFRERAAFFLLFGSTRADGSMISQVRDYLDNLDNGDADNDEESDRIFRVILNALESITPATHLLPERLNNLIQDIFTSFENQTPSRVAICQYAQKWVDNPGKREEMRPHADDAPAQDTAANKPAAVQKRNYKHDYSTLDQEIALALLPINENDQVSVRTLRAAEGIINEDREDFKRWSAALRITENILKYSRASIFGVVSNVPSKDTYHFPNSLRQHIDAWLVKNGQLEEQPESQPKVSNLGNGMFSVDVPETGASNQGEKTEVPQPEVSEKQAMAARDTLNKMGLSVYATDTNATSSTPVLPEAPEPSSPVQSHTGESEQGIPDEPVKEEPAGPRVEDVEKSLSSGTNTDNLSLWKRVFKTDERFTKVFTQNGGGTSINGTYMTMLATREFGPKGIGWGVEILEERFDNGAPITRKIKGSDGNETWELIPDGKGGYLTEINHVIKIKLWYMTEDMGRGEEIAYGCTPYLYGSKYGPTCDGEATKKSLTDATKKALSSLGFSADIFMGLYDNPEYRQKNKEEFALKNASENAEDVVRLRQELDEKLTRVANTLATGVSANEVTKVFASIAREVEVHRKDAEAKGDSQHASYLSKRIRRLTTIKDERLKELNKSQEKSA